MSRCVTFLTAAVLLALLSAGCGGTLGPAPKQSIRFEAGSLLLRNDTPETKFGGLVDGPSFPNGSSFLLYGRKNTESLLFAPREISLSGSKWGYSNPEQWDWTSSTDYYDFLALYLGDLYDLNRPSVPIPSCNTGSPMYASVAYDPSVDQFDLMLAGKRRTYDDPEGRASTVHMSFEHMLCAVQLKVQNGSTTKAFTVTGYHFENLVSRGTAKVEAGASPTFSWTSTSRLAASVGGTANLSSEELAVLASASIIPHAYSAGESQGDHGYYDLMIPQSHSEKIGADGWPALVLEYTPEGGSPTSLRILLKEIYTDPAQGTPTLISSWERGNKYVYVVKLSLDGGIQIHVTTTNWDSVTAETPGLLLPTLGT